MINDAVSKQLLKQLYSFPSVDSSVAANIFALAGAVQIVAGILPFVPPILTVPTGQAIFAKLYEQIKSNPYLSKDIVAELLAVAVQILSPVVPPAGVRIFKQKMKQLFGTPRSVSQIADEMTTAIKTYFVSGGVV